jgi:hypothetical protein
MVSAVKAVTSGDKVNSCVHNGEQFFINWQEYNHHALKI